jgi:ribosomal protein L24E
MMLTEDETVFFFCASKHTDVLSRHNDPVSCKVTEILKNFCFSETSTRTVRIYFLKTVLLKKRSLWDKALIPIHVAAICLVLGPTYFGM